MPRSTIPFKVNVETRCGFAAGPLAAEKTGSKIWFAARQDLICGEARFDLQRVHVFCGATNDARVEIFQLFGSKRVMTANQRSTTLPKLCFASPSKLHPYMHGEQAICYDGPLVTVGNVFTWVNNLTVLHHFTISLVNQSLLTFGNKHVLCRCPMWQRCVSCFCWFCLGWVFINIYKKVKSIYIL